MEMGGRRVRAASWGIAVRAAGLGLAGAALVAWPATAAPASAGDLLPGGLLWSLPFVGLLLSIALGPLLAERFWHHNMGAIAAAWSLLLLVPFALVKGVGEALHLGWHAVLAEYLPFVSLIFALFTVGGGIVVHGGPWGRPLGNALLLGIGALLASVMGTTGAAMVLIHPLLRANAWRERKLHLAVFFILLVANVGGSLSPLGDPPLFIGFLRGVPFFWPTVHLLLPMLTVTAFLLAVFLVFDTVLARREAAPPAPARPLRLRGGPNLLLLAAAIAAVLLQGVWQPGAVTLLGQPIGLEKLVGSLTLLAIGGISAAITPLSAHEDNLFSWAPFAEVAKLFVAIFITMAPVLMLLDAGIQGPFGSLLTLATDARGEPIPAVFFWMTGMLSGFLDNAPTYAVFFEMAGGDPRVLAGADATTLGAISAGAVFFGALTYIGNAPNFMVRAIASRRGVRMPGFLGYMLWSVPLLAPPLLLVTWLFFS